MNPAESGVATARPLAELTVGLLGTGRMGSAMAATLAGKGARMVVYNRTAERARALAERLGARAAATPAEVAADVDVLITMVADDDAVRELYEGDDGILVTIGPRTVAVDMSTVLPDTIRGLEAAVRTRGAGILDAPVSGSVATASSGQLAIMVGGEAADLERARPVLEGLASRIFHLGPLGSGATMKLAVNSVVFGLNGVLSEALVLAEKAGVDRATAWEVFAGSAIGAPFVTYKRAAFVEPEATPPAFSVDLARKDLRLIFELADRVGASMPQSRTNDELLGDAATDLGGESDMSAVAVQLRSRTGRRGA